MKIKVFHMTKEAAVASILENGFRETDRGLYSGNFVSAYPLSLLEGAKGGKCLEIIIESTPEQMFYQWEIIQDGKPYREWCIPAAVLNISPMRLLTDEECERAQAEEYWNEYPPGEPERAFADLNSGPVDDDEFSE